MHNPLLRIAAISLVFSGLAGSIYSSDSLKVSRSKFFFDNLSAHNTWIHSINPAGIALFDHFTPVNLLEAGFTYEDKEVHFPGEPGIINDFYTKVKGYRNIGKLMTFGSFGYENAHYNELRYNNTMIFDPDDPYILGDTAGGKQRLEGFTLRGSIAYPLRDKLIVGIDADYRNYVGAKHNDPRNRNDISSLEITPGLIFTTGKISAGISGGPVIYNNEVSIQVMEDTYDMYQFLGYGYYRRLKNVVNYENAYFGRGFNSEAQFRVQKGNYSNFTVIGYRTYSEDVRYGGTFRLHDGVSDKLSLSFRNYQKITGNKKTTQVNLLFDMSDLNGTQIMQHFETILEGAYSYDSLVTDHWIEGKHIVNKYSGAVEYILTCTGENDQEKYRFRLGVSSVYHYTGHYPVQTNGSQEVHNFMINTGFRKPFSFQSFSIIPEVGLAGRINLLAEKTYTVISTSFPGFQEQDFVARYSEFIKADASMTFLKKTQIKSLPEYFFSLNSAWTHFPDAGAVKRNVFFNCTVGLVF